MKTGELKRTQ